MTSAKKVDDAKKAQLTFTDSDVSIEHIEKTGDEKSVAYLVNNPQALAQAYATAGMFFIHFHSLHRLTSRTGNASVLHNKNVLLCAVTAAFGGLTFGYDQGMISVTLVMQPFLQVSSLHALALQCLTLLSDRARDRRRIPPRGLQQGLAHCDPRARGYDR